MEIIVLSENELEIVTGGGLFYDLGAFFAKQGNISDSINRQYGKTSKNNYW